jgi:hypothetical protein
MYVKWNIYVPSETCFFPSNPHFYQLYHWALIPGPYLVHFSPFPLPSNWVLSLSPSPCARVLSSVISPGVVPLTCAFPSSSLPKSLTNPSLQCCPPTHTVLSLEEFPYVGNHRVTFARIPSLPASEVISGFLLFLNSPPKLIASDLLPLDAISYVLATLLPRSHKILLQSYVKSMMLLLLFYILALLCISFSSDNSFLFSTSSALTLLLVMIQSIYYLM